MKNKKIIFYRDKFAYFIFSIFFFIILSFGFIVFFPIILLKWFIDNNSLKEEINNFLELKDGFKS